MSTVPTSGPMQRVDPDAPGRVVTAPPRVTPQQASPTRQNAQERQQKAFYELDRWSKYNDPLLVVGFLVVVISVACMVPRSVFLPLAGVLLGVGMVKLAWMMGQGK